MPISRISGPALGALDAASTLTIHSVFDTAVNLRAGVRLITCTSRRLAAPHGVELTVGDLRRLRDYGRQHSAASLYWNTCRHQIADMTGALAVRSAPNRIVFDPLLPVIGPSGWASGVASFIGHLAHRRPLTGFGADWPALITEKRLVDAVASIVGGRVDDTVLYWLGRGPGLTPSGDDILIGVLAALWSAGVLTGESMAALRQPLESAARTRTNDISAEYLHYACRGMAAGPLHDLLVALHGRRPAAVGDVVDRLAIYGHTSGADIALGAITALRYISSISSISG
ncbi:MAG TPA: DUF2877 domain-containing protein [Mycobacterium sp.]|nr:DUF2877 domain-containing protein [Mycobacterium sp.]